jgi:hypothetical protein
MPIAHDLLSVAEAAAALRLSPAAVRAAIWRGLIQAVRVDAHTSVISRDEIARYQENHLRRRGPKGPRTTPGEDR